MTIYEALGRRWKIVSSPTGYDDPEDDEVTCKALDNGELHLFRFGDLRVVALIDTKGELNEALE
jgi:hypothetical protein